MRCLESVDFIFCLAPTHHGYSISAQSYEFWPHLAELDNLDFTLYICRHCTFCLTKHLCREPSRHQLITSCRTKSDAILVTPLTAPEFIIYWSWFVFGPTLLAKTIEISHSLCSLNVIFKTDPGPENVYKIVFLLNF